jgi:hypothetical protein
MNDRYRQEAPALKGLIRSDELLAGHCELLRSMVSGKMGAALLESLPDVESELEAIRCTLRDRASVLLDPARMT